MRSCALLLLLLLTSAQAQLIQDDFDRPDSTTVTGWTERTGDWQIVNMRLEAQATSSFQEITFDAATGITDATVTSEVYYSALGTGVRYIGHIHRWTSASNRIFCKVQDNSSSGNYNRAFVYEGSGASLGYYDIIAPFTSAIIQTEVTGPTFTLRIDQNMDSVWDETHVFSPTTVLGAGQLGICGYNNGIIDNWDATGGGFGGPAALEVNTIDTLPTTVAQGDTGILVTMSVDNTGTSDADTVTASLTFTGIADRTAEYVVTPDPTNPTVIAPAATEVLSFTVDVDPLATLEIITIDGQVDGNDTFSSTPIQDIGALVTDSWDVIWTCLAPLCGDCNGDGTVSILDALVAAQNSAALIVLTGYDFSNCNVIGALEPDPLAEVSILDALTLAQAAAGLAVTLACC